MWKARFAIFGSHPGTRWGRIEDHVEPLFTDSLSSGPLHIPALCVSNFLHYLRSGRLRFDFFSGF